MRVAQMATPVFAILCSCSLMPTLGSVRLGLAIQIAFAETSGDQRKSLRPIIRSAAAGQPVKLRIRVPKDHVLRFVRILGIPPGFRLSHGFSLRDGSIWYVASSDLATLELVPPADFVGVGQLYVDFFTQHGISKKPVYAKSEWYVVKIGAESDRGAPAAVSGTERPAAEPPPAPRPEQLTQPYEAEAEALLRAQELVERGDVTAARLLYEDLAIHGSASGALALARTYDPDFLQSLGVIGMEADLNQARKWYKRAEDLGNKEASQRLSELK